MPTYCALCGAPVTDPDKAAKLNVVVSRAGEKAHPLAQTRPICDTCADPPSIVAIQSLVRRLHTAL